jgi:hypothetical protein
MLAFCGLWSSGTGWNGDEDYLASFGIFRHRLGHGGDFLVLDASATMM